MKSKGVNIIPTDINKSVYTFSPDVENNSILYGLSGITKVGDDLVRSIINNRPYESIEDFLDKVKINKPQMVNLIKSGAFDSFDETRVHVMRHYINLIADQKKRVTLQNMKMLMDFNLIPSEFELQCKVYNFNKYLKKHKVNEYYAIDDVSFNFYEKNFDVDLLTPTNDGFLIEQKAWDKIYKKQMDIIRPYIKQNNEYLLAAINNKLWYNTWNKYCQGTISHWEMDSISCYIHEHELSKTRNSFYGFVDYAQLSEKPQIDYTFTLQKTGKQIPMFKIYRIAGTVLDKDKAKKTVTLLTTSGVVNVKIFGGAFSHYDKQLSERGPDGKKHVTEPSWFSRGNKVIATGIRRGDNFICKKYKRTPWHLIELIEEVDDEGYLTIKREREE